MQTSPYQRDAVSSDIKEIVDNWKEDGSIGNSHPDTKKKAIKQAVAISLKKNSQSKYQNGSKTGSSSKESTSAKKKTSTAKSSSTKKPASKTAAKKPTAKKTTAKGDG